MGSHTGFPTNISNFRKIVDKCYFAFCMRLFGFYDFVNRTMIDCFFWTLATLVLNRLHIMLCFSYIKL